MDKLKKIEAYFCFVSITIRGSDFGWRHWLLVLENWKNEIEAYIKKTKGFLWNSRMMKKEEEV